MSDQLSRFLRNLSLDPGLREAFEERPEEVLADSDLSEADKSVLLQTDLDDWARDVVATNTPQDNM